MQSSKLRWNSKLLQFYRYSPDTVHIFRANISSMRAPAYRMQCAEFLRERYPNGLSLLTGEVTTMKRKRYRVISSAEHHQKSLLLTIIALETTRRALKSIVAAVAPLLSSLPSLRRLINSKFNICSWISTRAIFQHFPLFRILESVLGSTYVRQRWTKSRSALEEEANTSRNVFVSASTLEDGDGNQDQSVPDLSAGSRDLRTHCETRNGPIRYIHTAPPGINLRWNVRLRFYQYATFDQANGNYLPYRFVTHDPRVSTDSA